MTAKTSDCVKVQSVDSLVIRIAVTTISTAPKKYEYAVTDIFAGYFFKTGAWKFWRILSSTYTKGSNCNNKELNK